ncbi:hypothetical protein BXT96_12545 [Enterococcus faecium]|nr:hypothetical protein BXT96_12545 [Enterococcus faecium]MCZ1463259.1 hypothetical protein [Enterococcus faecium]QBF49484.1 hypothetical protein EXV96_07845 [Enterococcus faecium]QEX01231.1 hypothetical protein F6440_05845 [Enterococcus faecium]
MSQLPKHIFESWVLSFLKYKKISNQSTLLSYYVIHSNKREYKIFCVNEKIHTKKEVPSVE